MIRITLVEIVHVSIRYIHLYNLHVNLISANEAIDLEATMKKNIIAVTVNNYDILLNIRI